MTVIDVTNGAILWSILNYGVTSVQHPRTQWPPPNPQLLLSLLSDIYLYIGVLGKRYKLGFTRVRLTFT